MPFALFDPEAMILDETGQPIRYLTHPLDEQYAVPPGDLALEGMLPPEDLEVRRALAEMK